MGRFRNFHVLHVRAYGHCPVSLAMTHMRLSHSQCGRGSTDHTLCVVHCVGGLRAWLTDKCSNENVGENERKTPPLCESEQAKREKKEK